MDNVIDSVALFNFARGCANVERAEARLLADVRRVNAEAGAQAKVDAFVDALVAQHNRSMPR